MGTMRFRGIAAFIAVAAALTAAQKLAPKGAHWKTGKLLDTEADTRTVQSGTMNWPGFPGGSMKQYATLKDTLVAVLGDEYLYVAKETIEPGRLFGRKGCRYIVSDPIEYSQDKDKLYVRDADGQECGLMILRQERIPAKQNTDGDQAPAAAHL